MMMPKEPDHRHRDAGVSTGARMMIAARLREKARSAAASVRWQHDEQVGGDEKISCATVCGTDKRQAEARTEAKTDNRTDHTVEPRWTRIRQEILGLMGRTRRKADDQA